MSKLEPILKFGFAGSAERSRLLGKAWFKKELEGIRSANPYSKEHELMDAHALLQTEKTAINDSTLVQEEVYRTVLEGTEPARCMRDVVPTIQTDSYSVRFVKGEAGTYSGKIAEGGVIDVDTQTYTKQDITIDKYGTRPLITNELIEDSLFGIIELELKKAGTRMENGLNRVILDQILNGDNKISTSTLNPEGTHLSVSDLARAVAMIKKQDYLPDCLVTHPTAEGYLLQDSNLAYVSYAGSPGALRQGNPGTNLMGLKLFTCTATDKASGPTWDDTTAGSDVTAIVLSKNDLAALCMRRDLTVERYEDPIHDLVGISLTQRYGTDVLHEKSGCIIYHK